MKLHNKTLEKDLQYLKGCNFVSYILEEGFIIQADSEEGVCMGQYFYTAADKYKEDFKKLTEY